MRVFRPFIALLSLICCPLFSQSVQYSYDQLGRLVGTIDTAGNAAHYSYDANGNILSISRYTSAQVSVLSFAPASGPVGATIAISGTNFSTVASNNIVSLNGVRANVISATANQLNITVPSGATTGPIAVGNSIGSASSSDSFYVTVGGSGAPTISSFTPAIAPPGSVVSVAGTHFSSTNSQNKVLVGNPGQTANVSGTSATSLSFTVPQNSRTNTSGSGHISVVTAAGSATSAADLYIPPPPYPASQVLITQRLTIGSSNNFQGLTSGIGMFLFDGAAGQLVDVALTNFSFVGNCPIGMLTVLKPDGTLLSSSTGCSSSNVILSMPLPITGTYAVVLYPQSGLAGGTGTISVTTDQPTSLATDSSIPFSITNSGHGVQYSFSGSKGQEVNVALTNSTFASSCTVSVTVLSPQGTQLGSGSNCNSASFSVPFIPLATTGTYTISVLPLSGGTGSGTITLSTDLHAAIVPGNSLSFNTTLPGQNAQFAFSGTAGQQVNAAFINSTFSGSCSPVVLMMLSPDGTQLSNSYSGACGAANVDLPLLTLTSTGTYTIIVVPENVGIGGGTVTLSTDQHAAITPNNSVSFNITIPGQNVQYSFSGTAGQEINVALTNSNFSGGCFSLVVTVLNPDGTQLSSNSACGSANVDLPFLTLPTTGTYTIIVEPQNGNIGGGTLTLSTDQHGTIAIGNSVTVNITIAGQNAQYTFNGTAGQEVNLAITSGTFTGGCYQTALTVMKPDGTQLTSGNGCYSGNVDLPFIALPTTGAYTIIVAPQNGSTGSGLLTLSTDQHGTVTLGNPVTVSITTPGQNAQYTFSGTASQVVNVSITNGTFTGGCYQDQLIILKPDGTQLTSAYGCSSGNVALSSVTLATSGTYTIVVAPQNGGTGGGTLLAAAAPVISSISPNPASTGSAITVSGTGFGQSQGSSTLTLGGNALTASSWSNTSISAVLPNGAATGSMVVTVGGVASSPAGLTVTALTATTTSLSASNVSPAPGSNITLTATVASSSAIGSVTFQDGTTTLGTGTLSGGVATYTITSIVVGSHSYTAVYGGNSTYATSSSSAVVVTANSSGPVLNSMSPAAGVPGVLVTVSGVHFGTSQGTSSIALNGTAITPSSWSDTTILATIPVSAQTGNVVVTVGGVSSGGATFTVVSPNGGYMRLATIAHTMVPNTDQVNFPVLISGVYPFLASAANGGRVQSTSGYDIFFTSDAAGQNLLNHEIDNYNPATGAAAFWVRVPTLSHTADTVIYMWYGFPGITQSQENVAGVWSNGYAGVWHMGNSSGLSTTDSTSNANNATNHGVASAAGIIGSSGSFDGTGNTYFRIPSSTSFKPTTAITLEAWVNMAGATSYPDFFSLDYRADGTWTAPFQAYALDLSAGGLAPRLDFALAGAQASYSGASNLTLNQWSHVVGTYDGTKMIVYANGIPVVTQSATGAISYGTSQDLDMGTRSPYTSAEAVNGKIDEARISTTARSADWIATEYNNQSSPSTFFSLGAEQPGTSLTATTTSLSSSNVSPAPGSNVTLTATVASSSATGTVTFKDGATVLGTGTLSSGVATYTVSAIVAGSHSYTAVYGGNSTYATSTSSAVVVSALTATTTTLTSSSVSPAPGSNITLTATVASSSAAGTVTFKDGATTLGTGTLSSGVATYAVTAIVAGSHSYAAVYGGSSTYATSTSSAVVVSALTATTTSLSSSSVSPAPGSNITLTATVASSSATGIVTFKDGSTTLGTGTLSGGVATYAVTAITAGSHSYTAVYGGSSSYATSTSSVVAVTTLTATTTSLSSSNVSPTPGSNITLTATVASSSATGTVTFMDGATTLGTGTLSSGVATYAVTAIVAGSHSYAAVYGGSSSYATSTSSAVVVSALTATTTSLSSSSVSPAPGSNITLTATVASSSATGTVTFKDGATILGTGTLSSGVATYTVTSIVSGSHSYAAVYGGSSSYATSTSSVVAVTTLTATTTSLSSSNVSPTPGSNITLTATVASSSATGTVTFMDGATTLGTGTLSSGVATYAVTAITAGSHSYAAVYGGSSSYATSTSSAVVVSALTATTTSLSSSSVSPAPGSNITLTATVASSSATGTVTFKDGATILGTGTLSSGVATYTVTSIVSGSHSYAAVYGGSSSYATSTSSVVAVTTLTATTTSLSSSNVSPTPGSNITLTATVASSSATGTVTFMDGATTLGTGTLSSGVATYAVTAIVAGSHSYAAVYGGSSTYATSTSSAVVVSALTATTTSLSSSSVSPAPGSNITLTATVASSSATGIVTFKDGSTTLGTGTLSGGVATYAVTAITAGSHSYTAVYGGSSSYATSTSSVVAVTTLTATTTSLSSSNVSPTPGSNITLTATVASSSATGTVTFMDGATTLGTGTLSSGVATYAVTAITAGSHSYAAVYGGSSSYATSTSSAVVVSALTATTTSLSSSSVSPAPGSNITLTATVASSSATGIVTFKDGSTTLGTGTLSGGVATYAVTAITAGSHSYTAVYGGSSSYATSTSSVITVTTLTTTTTALTSSSTSPAPGSNITLTATVASSSATGTVTFKDGATTLGTGTLSSGVATYAVTAIAAGSHSYTAVYAGSSTYATSTSSAVVVSALTATTTSLSSSSTSPAPGSNITLTATVASTSATGTVTFKDGTTTLGTGTLSGGVATYTVTAIAAGSHSYTAVYGGSSTYATSSSSAVAVTTLTATTTALTSSSASPAPGSNITLTATVASSSATGTVTFKDGTTTLGTGTLSSGVATYTVTAIAAGSHSYTAVYGGNSTYATSTSSAVVVSALTATTTALTSSSASPAPGSNITLTATVASSSATGTVTFKDGTTTLGTGTLSGGVATYTVTAIAAGSHSYTAVYGGSSTYATSSSSAVAVITLTATTTALTSSSSSPAPGSNITLTATVASSSATGTVTFMDGATTLGTGTLSSGVATYTVTAIAAGSHSYTAVYGGSSTYATSTSTAVVVSAIAPGSLLAPGNSASFSITTAGQNVQYTFSGTANQQVNVALTNSTFSGYCYTVSLTVLKPDGTQLNTGNACGSSNLDLSFLTLPTSGTYTIVVAPQNGLTGSGTVTLSTDLHGAVTLGNSASFNITTAGQNVQYTFSGTANQQVNVALTNSTFSGYCNTVTVTVLNPDGTQLNTGSACGSANLELGLVTLPTTGTYTIVVAPVNALTGGGTITLSADQRGSIVLGNSATFNITTAGQNVQYTFSGTANQQVNVALTNSTFSGYCNTVTVTILKPDGTQLGTGGACGAGNLEIPFLTLPTTGTYIILVAPVNALTGGGTITLSSDLRGSIILGNSAAFNITTAGQNVQYTFTGAASQQVNVTLTNSTFSGYCNTVVVNIWNPDGTQLSTGSACGGSDIDLNSITLPAAGTYSIVVAPVNAGTGGGTITLTAGS